MTVPEDESPIWICSPKIDETDLSGEFQVDDTGYVRLPLIGQVKAAGHTAFQLEGDVSVALNDGYLKNPRVNVEVSTYRPFYIIGEVNKPGEYPYESGLSLHGAVALAGGYTYRANDSNVYIRRVGSDGETSMRVTGQIKIYPGDVVRIPERFF